MAFGGMTQQELIELVQQHHPEMGIVEVRKALNRAQSQFCSETEILEDTFTDNFNGWSVGYLQVLDKLDSQFDGSKKSFRLSVNDETISIQASKGSAINVEDTLLVFINEVLQEQGVVYEFKVGRVIEFS